MALKEAKVPDDVIKFMMQWQSLQTEKIKNEIDEDRVWTKVETDASFPGKTVHGTGI